MRTAWILALLFFATSLIAFAKKEETLEQLVSRAQSAKVQDQPELYTEAAERQLAAADKLYIEGQMEDARKAIQDVVSFSDKAAEAANTSGKHIKHTEISLRKMAAKLRDIKRALAFEDQAPVQDAANHLEELRTNLLTRMFGKDQK
jgi:uncharacterized tellurite resistance protein B-like protein